MSDLTCCQHSKKINDTLKITIACISDSKRMHRNHRSRYHSVFCTMIRVLLDCSVLENLLIDFEAKSPHFVSDHNEKVNSYLRLGGWTYQSCGSGFLCLFSMVIPQNKAHNVQSCILVSGHEMVRGSCKIMIDSFDCQRESQTVSPPRQ